MDERRTKRVSVTLRDEIGEIVGFELDDPRLRFITVTDVFLSSDGRHARVKVGISGNEHQHKEALAALEHARNYVRGEVARRLSLRRVPELSFEEDRFGEVEGRIEVLLKRAEKMRGRE
jgi:ribosome-binding factor A